MKKNSLAIAIVVIALLIWVSQARAAITVISDPTNEQFAGVYSTGLFSWSVTFETGYPSTGTPEIKVISNRLVTADHAWSTPEQVEVGYDEAGNLNVRAGSTTLSVQPTTPFNTVLIRLGDRARFSTYTELRNITFDATSLRNMFADDLGTFVTDNDYQIVSGFGDTFSLRGSFFKSPGSVGNESQLEITGVWMVPEPSTSFLFMISIIGVFFRRR
jgi:hypothetical protein